MNNRKQVLAILICTVILTLLIIDTSTAVAGANEGVALCIKVIIPSLFPFFLVTTYMNSLLPGVDIPGICMLGRFLHIPLGSEPLLVLGLLGGYPVGAKLIGDAFTQKKIDKRTGQILLGYCNNSGPAFIFGVAGRLFSNLYVPVCLWLTHILSAIITGFILPKPNASVASTDKQKVITIPEALHKSMSVCISVCGWVIIFKIIMNYITVYLDSYISKTIMIIITGVLELSNGCLMLTEINTEPVRFLLCSAFFALGGLCVALQTISVTGALKWGLYIPGKIIQTCISLLLSVLCIQFLYPNERIKLEICGILIGISLFIIAGIKRTAEKSCGNLKCNHV